MQVSTVLTALEQLSASTSTSSSGPLNALIDQHFSRARTRITAGEDPKTVITDLQKAVTRSKKDVEKGLKAWYAALGNVGKQIDKVGPLPEQAQTRSLASDVLTATVIPAEPRRRIGCIQRPAALR
jgi:hypothetical protein